MLVNMDDLGVNRPMTANQLWKKSGSTLPFKQWMDQENQKYAHADGEKAPFPALSSDSLNGKIKQTLDTMNATGPAPITTLSGNTILGINKYVIIAAGMIIGGAIAYKIYQATKNKTK